MRVRFWVAALVLALCTTANAELQPERMFSRTLPAKPNPHWVFVNDLVFNHMEAGKSFLIDADSGQMLGMLSTGFFFESVILPSDYSAIYTAETYFSRGTRGERTDIVAVYNPTTLSPDSEVIIPPKQISVVPVAGHANLSTDDRFMALYNFTPAQSVSLVDVTTQKFLEEYETPGCAGVYTAGPRAFTMVCGNGSMLTLELGDDGKVASTSQSEPFFDPNEDIVDDKVARHGDIWFFFTMSGAVKPVDTSQGKPQFLPEWRLFDDSTTGWKLGGFQYATINPTTNELYVLVHEGGEWTHKDPGKNVWVYDLASKQRTRTIELEHIAFSIEVSNDAEPLLYTADAEHSGLHVYDAQTGQHLREIAEIGFSPVLLQAVPLIK
ncbi:MAG: amine dehydrogenase large subunit [Pseudomonadota bacterium]